MPKTLLLSLPYGMCARNVLRSGAWETLRRHVRVVVVSPLARSADFRAEAGGGDVSFEEYPIVPARTRLLLRLLVDAETLGWAHARRIGTFAIIEATIAAGMADPILGKFKGSFSRRSRLLVAQPRLRALLRRAVDVGGARHAGYRRLLERSRPDLAFLTHPYTWDERFLTPALQARGIRTVAMIHSWDNPTTHPVLLARYDRILVWNAILRDQMTRLYDYPPSQVTTTGMPQTDAYLDPALAMDRAEFLFGLGLEPSRRLITYACGAPEFVPDQDRIVGVLADAIQGGGLVKDASVVVRLHPGRGAGPIATLRRPGLVHIDEPSAAYNANRTSGGWRRDRDDDRRFVNLLRHSDVFVNAFSTTTLDAAAFDTPIVNIAFDWNGPMPYHASLVKHYDWDHYVPIVQSGGVRLARSPQGLLDAVNAYLADPSLDREGRRRIVAEQCGPLDRRAGRRVAEAVLREMGVDSRDTTA